MLGHGPNVKYRGEAVPSPSSGLSFALQIPGVSFATHSPPVEATHAFPKCAPCLRCSSSCAQSPSRQPNPHPSLPPPVIPECLGVQIDFTEPKPGELQMLAAAGFRWVRLDLSWASTERKKGEYDFSAYDRLAAALAQLQLRAVFVLSDGNPLYAEPGDQPPFTSRGDTAEFREAFAAWTVAAVGHFRGRGYLWEMGNEPNRKTLGKTPGDVRHYIALATTTGEALRTAGLLGPQGEAFIGPATGGVDLSFLEACFKKGLLGYWDAVSVHPTRNDAPETVEKDLRQLRLLIRKYAPVEKVIPVISSGWGYSSTSPALGQDDFERRQTQAGYLAREFLANMANEVALSIWADWRDDNARPATAERGFGLIEHEYNPTRTSPFQPKPAYIAMQTLAREFAGFRFNKRLHSWDSEDDYLLLFEKQGDVRAAAWTVRKKPIKIGIAASPGDLTMATTAEGRGGHPGYQGRSAERFRSQVHPQRLARLLPLCAAQLSPAHRHHRHPAAPRVRFQHPRHLGSLAFHLQKLLRASRGHAHHLARRSFQRKMGHPR